jgi:hypothetical protein
MTVMRTGIGFSGTTDLGFPSTIIYDSTNRYRLFGSPSNPMAKYDGWDFSEIGGLHQCVIADDGGINRIYNLGNTGFNEYTYCAVNDPTSDGDVFVGGNFTQYNGVSSPRLVKLNSNGHVDTGFTAFDVGTGFNSYVYQINYLTYDNSLIVGGNFTSYKGTSVNKFCKISQYGNLITTGGWASTGFTYTNSTPFDAYSQLIQVSTGGTIYVGGKFSSYNGNSSNYIASINADGTYNSSFNVGTGFNSSPSFLHLDEAEGTLLVGGDFTSYNGTSGLNGVIKLNLDGSITSGFTGFTETFGTLAFGGLRIGTVDDNGYYFGSPYDDKYIIKMNPNGSLATGFTTASGGTSGYGGINDIIINPDGNPLIVGNFTTINTETWNGIVTLDRDSGAIISSTESALYSSLEYTGVTCAEASDGRIEFVDYTGGSGSYEFSINDSGSNVDWYTNPLFTGLTNQVTYVCSIRDANDTDYVVGVHNGLVLSGPDPLDGGEICCSQLIEAGEYPQYIANVTLGSGGSGTSWYGWEKQETVDGAWTDLSTTTEYYQPPELYVNTNYRRYFINDCGTAYTNTVSITMNYPLPWCEVDNNYSTVDATCSERDGQVIINDADYTRFYDFVLSDPFGTSNYIFYTDRFYPTAGWYTLTGIPKTEYRTVYGKIGCSYDWIQINNSDTTMTLDNKSIRDASCGTFGATSGRIVYFCSDTYGGSDYDVYLFNEAGETVYFENMSDISQIVISGLVADKYYLMILNNSGANGGCRLLDGATQIKSLNSISVSGIKRIFVTEWNKLIEYNYWSAADEDYYVSGLDSNFFASIKIKEFIDSTLPSAWFEIIMDNKFATFKQTMNKTKQGFIFTDNLVITIPHADNAKWQQLIDFLANRYVVVFEDNNGYFWCMGYSLGAKVDGYRRSLNEYELILNAISDNNILTNISKEYVVNNIINS